MRLSFSCKSLQWIASIPQLTRRQSNLVEQLVASILRHQHLSLSLGPSTGKSLILMSVAQRVQDLKLSVIIVVDDDLIQQSYHEKDKFASLFGNLTIVGSKTPLAHGLVMPLDVVLYDQVGPDNGAAPCAPSSVQLFTTTGGRPHYCVDPELPLPKIKLCFHKCKLVDRFDLKIQDYSELIENSIVLASRRVVVLSADMAYRPYEQQIHPMRSFMDKLMPVTDWLPDVGVTHHIHSTQSSLEKQRVMHRFERDGGLLWAPIDYAQKYSFRCDSLVILDLNQTLYLERLYRIVVQARRSCSKSLRITVHTPNNAWALFPLIAANLPSYYVLALAERCAKLPMGKVLALLNKNLPKGLPSHVASWKANPLIVTL